MIQVKTKDLNRVLGVAIKALPTKTSNAIFECVLLKGEGNTLSVIATGDNGITVVQSIPSEGEGEWVVNAKQFADIVKSIPSTDIRLEDKEGGVAIKWERGEMTVGKMNKDDYPIVGGVEGEGIKYNADTLARGLKHTQPLISADNSLRPVLGGIFFDIEDTKTTLVSSDTHALMTTPIDGGAKETEGFILSVVAVNILKDILPKEGEVEISQDERNIGIKFEGVEIIVRKIEGKFPNYKSIFPKANDKTYSSDKGSLVDSVNRIGVCANKSSNSIVFEFGVLGSEANCQDLSFQLSAREALEGTFEGENIKIAFKAALLSKVLSTMESSNISLHLTEANRAVIIKGEGEDSVGLIMPVTIN